MMRWRDGKVVEGRGAVSNLKIHAGGAAQKRIAVTKLRGQLSFSTHSNILTCPWLGQQSNSTLHLPPKNSRNVVSFCPDIKVLRLKL